MLLWQFPLFYPSMGQSSHIWRTDLIPWEGICNPCSIWTVAFQPDLRSVSLLYFIWRKHNYFTACFQIIFDLIGHNQSERVKIPTILFIHVSVTYPMTSSPCWIVKINYSCFQFVYFLWELGLNWMDCFCRATIPFLFFFFFLLPHQLGFAMFQKRVVTYKDTD